MMIKRALMAGIEPAVHLLSPSEGMTKVAGLTPEVSSFIATLKPDPRYLYTLVNAMGYSEFFGANSNTDYYGYNEHLDFNGLLHAPENCAQHGDYAGWRTDPVVQQRIAKTWPFGYPSYYGATVYAHHKNENPATLGFGDVIYVGLNHAMKRVELVMRVDIALAEQRGHSAILDRIRRGDRVDVSMGCKVPFDLCSICTDWDAVKKAWKTYNPKTFVHPGVAILAYHRKVKPIRGLSVTPKDYCEHMTSSRGRILDDGRRVFVYNDFPRFFDISFVWVGADRTARVMWFMGDKGSKPTSSRKPLSVDDLVSDALGSMKVAHVETPKPVIKQAEINKEIPGGIARKIEMCANQEAALPFGALAAMSLRHGAKTLLSTLGGLGIVLRPQEFHVIIAAHSPAQKKLAQMALDTGVTFKSSMPGFDKTAMVEASAFSPNLAQELMEYAPARSSFAPHLHARLIEALGTKTASVVAAPQVLDDMFVQKVAAMYNGYRMSLMKEAAALMPRYFETNPVSVEASMKTASSTALLLSSPTVVHWVSAHLEKVAEAEVEVGEVVKYVMRSPDSQKLSAIGDGVGVAMERGTNYISALKAAVNAAL